MPLPSVVATASRAGTGRPRGFRVDDPWRLAGWVAAIAAVGLLIGLPLLELGATVVGAGAGPVLRAIGASGQAILNTALVGVAVTLLALAAGTAAAFVTERTAAPGRRWLRLAVLAPLLVPGYVTALSWGRAFGSTGLSNRVLGLELPGLEGPVGIVAVLAVENVPLVFLIVAATLVTRMEPDLERAARASGASAFRAAVTVTLPLLRPALAAAGLLVLVRTVNAFGVPAVLGIPGEFPVITTRLYRDLAFSADQASFERAIVLASLLVVIAFVAVVASEASGAGRGVLRATTIAGSAGGGRATRAERVAALVLWAAVAVTVVLPLIALVLAALTRAVGLPPVPENWTLDNVREAVTPGVVGALANSLLLATVGAIVAVVLGGLLAWLTGVARTRDRRSGRALGAVVLLAFAVPGSALAVGVLLAFGASLRDTLALILVAYVAKFWALAHRPLAGGIDRLPSDALRAARISGAGPLTTLRTVALPLLWPVIAAALLLVFLFGIHELTMSILLYGPGTATLAVVVLNLQQLGNPASTAAMAVLLTLVVLALAAPLSVVARRGLGARSWP